MEDTYKGRRYILTVNNPFWSGQFEEIDINNTDLPIRDDYVNMKYIDTIFNRQFFVFKYVKWELKLSNGETEYICIKKPFFIDDNAVQDYIENIPKLRYSIFQVEVGHQEETEHLQMYLNFTESIRFKKLKEYFPSAHFEEAQGTSAQCRDYCSKVDTRVRGPFEYGNFTEERSRTDYQGFFDMVKNGASNMELQEVYPSLYMRERNKIDSYRQDYFHHEHDFRMRTDLEVTYIYGEPGTGKSSYVVNKYGLQNIFRTCSYRQGAFDLYNGQDVLVFDEYDSDIDITILNSYLDIYPVTLNARYANRVACFHKVYIISNLSLKSQYCDVQINKPMQYKALLRRINNIVHFTSEGITVEKGVFECVQLGMTLLHNQISPDVFQEDKVEYKE